MKKKIINGLLMMALVVSTTSSFVSCKDTAGDDYARFEEKFYQQDTYIKDVLLLQITNLKTDLSKVLNLKTVNNGQGGYLGEVVFKTEYEDLLKTLENMTKGINVPGTGAGGGATQNLTDWINAVNAMLQELYGQGGATSTSLAQLIQDVNTLKEWVNNYKPVTDLTEQVNKNKNDIATMLLTLNTLNTLATTLQTDLATLQTHLNDTLNNYYTKAETYNRTEIDTKINKLITDLNNHKVAVDQRFTQISDSLSTAFVKMNAANTRIDSIIQNFATKKELADSVDSLRNEIVAAQLAAQNYAKSLVNTLSQTLNTRIDATNANVHTLKLTIGDIQKNIEALQAADDTIKTRLTNLEAAVDTLTKRVNAVEANVDKIFTAISKQVTGIIVQGAYSPVFGIGMLPTNFKSNILAAYYGVSTDSIEFPAKDALNYVFAEDFWQDGEEDFIDFSNTYKLGANKYMLSDSLNNAGKLYLTVNPSQVDFTGKIIELENSQKTAAPITLAPLEKSNDKLFFGWTRGNSENGFYEAKAKITEENIKAAKARINTDALVNAAKDLYQKHDKASLMEAAQAIISSNGDILDANAAKATYEGLNEKGEIEEKTTFSEYSIATTVLTPLSYNTLKGWNPTSIPGLDAVEKFLSEFFDKVDIKIDLGVKGLVAPEIKKIVIKDFDSLSKQWNIEVIIPAHSISMTTSGATVDINISGKDGKIYAADAYKDGELIPGSQPIGYLSVNKTITTGTITASNDVAITLTPDIRTQLKLVYDAFAIPLNDANQALDAIKNFVDQINDVLSSLNGNINSQIGNAKNDIKNQLISYLDRFEKKVLSYASYVNVAMQPILLIKNSDSFNVASKFEEYPSKIVSKSAALVPTSYNAELLTPAFKKFIVCTGAWTADGTFDSEEAKAANANNALLNKVFDGQERLVEFEGKAGYKYRLVYQALDYHGKIASSRYYVQF